MAVVQAPPVHACDDEDSRYRAVPFTTSNANAGSGATYRAASRARAGAGAFETVAHPCLGSARFWPQTRPLLMSRSASARDWLTIVIVRVLSIDCLLAPHQSKAGRTEDPCRYACPGAGTDPKPLGACRRGEPFARYTTIADNYL
jgi:hypothetical protein